MDRTTKPNVLFLFADQMHAFAMGCMGNHDIDTPYLDQLAGQGTLFRNCYTANPVCCPYRATLFNGRYSCQTGMIGLNNLPNPPGERCFPEILNESGYRTSYVGKWHIGDGGNQWVPPKYRCGFTDFSGYQCYNDFFSDICFFDEEGRKDERLNHRTEATTDVAIERLEKIKDEPFCMSVSYQNPHYPVQPSERFAEMYWDRDLTMRPNFQEREGAFLAAGRAGTREDDPDYLRRGEDTVSYIKMYYAMVTQLDEQIGRLMAILDEWGLTENTMVVFTSDHGDMQGSHGLFNKHVHYEESTRCPLIVRLPGTSGHVVDHPVGTTDFLPSILDFTGCPPSDMAEGRSFMELASGSTVAHKEAVFVENSRHYFMVRRGPHKMVVSQADYSPMHLYDLEADPYEMTDLVNSPENTAVQNSLVDCIRRWHRDVMSRANPKRWNPEDVKHWGLLKATPPPPEHYGDPEFISEWCLRLRS
ncbi:MAG: sulfatase-like hydrolase/transferase [Planctomycetota bacterium]|nr:sulfatase-like hydrolase/transferase [Planctomycetota bacterium]MDP7129280.1 sulfatase-like hydrolase/transferase [Planctomycetota bacterium]MDP7251153.1 sulfatase-like hydrolase/transferase [Planctomycetota bacterium]